MNKREPFYTWYSATELTGLCGLDALRAAFEAGQAAAPLPAPEVEPSELVKAAEAILASLDAAIQEAKDDGDVDFPQEEMSLVENLRAALDKVKS